MEQKYFVYDINQRDWVETKSPKLTGEVEKLHKMLVGQDDKIRYANNDLLWAVADFSLFDLSYSVTNINAVIRWRIQASERQQVVIIIGECCNLIEDKSSFFSNSPYSNNDRKRVKYQLMRNVNQISLRLDYKNRKYTAVPGERKQGALNGFTYNYTVDWTTKAQPKYVAVPQPVIAAAMDIMMEFAADEFAEGAAANVMINDVDLLKGFACYPLDPNVAFWVDTLDYGFSLKVNRKSSDNFPVLCEYMSIPQIEELGDVYVKNTKALLVIYYLKKYLEIEDINVWKLCYDAETLLNVNIANYGLGKNGELYNKVWVRSLSYREDDPMVKSLRDYYTWAGEKWSPETAGRHIADIVMHWNKDMEALLTMLEANGYELTENTMELLERLGLTKEVSEAVADEYEAKQAAEEAKAEKEAEDDGKVFDEFRLTKAELKREEKTALGEFLAARNEPDLWKITKAMDNYAFLRAHDAREKKCTVYYFQQKGKPVVYIEVRKGAVVAATSHGDERLAGGLLDEVKLWAFKYRLDFKA